MKNELRCYDCYFWCGRCRKGHINKIASDKACSDYQSQRQSFLVEIYLHGQKPVSEIDVALCLKNLPIDSSHASFKVTRKEELLNP